jgi:hypothetical protein
MRRQRLIAVGLLCSFGGCATYQPRASRYISRVSRSVYHRDGQEFHIGPLGGESEALVNDDPRALPYVERERHWLNLGVPLYVVSLATMLASPFVGAAMPKAARWPVGGALFGLGVGGSIASVGLLEKGNAALVDAINVYNDDIDVAPRTP